MCVLCSNEFVKQIHWTDNTMNTSNHIVAGQHQRDRQRTRIHRTNLCNQILNFYNLKLEDWHGTKYILRDLKGNQEIIQDLGSLWYSVEDLLGYPIDPLNPDILQKMKER